MASNILDMVYQTTEWNPVFNKQSKFAVEANKYTVVQKNGPLLNIQTAAQNMTQYQ